MAKQTAMQKHLEWLKGRMIVSLEMEKQLLEEEKQQIIWAHGIQMEGVNNHKCVTGEQYYNQTYKQH
jgi:hypothetical protein